MSPRIRKVTIQAPSGMYDIVPDDQKYWRFVFKKAQALLEDYSFDRIDTARIESGDLLAEVGGSESPHIRAVAFKIKNGDDVVANKDGLFGTVRAYLERGLSSNPHPIKLFYNTPALEYDLTGQLVQRHHLGVTTFGDASEVVDSELLFLAHKVLEGVGFRNAVVHINTVGDNSCRPAYIRALKDFYKNRTKNLCTLCRNNAKENALALLECAEDGCKEAAKDAPQMLDFLDDACRIHFRRTLEFLDSAKISYLIEPRLVHSAEYHTRTVFEFWPEASETAQAPLLSGGRCDRLVELVGGPKTPLAGWTCHVDGLVSLLKEKNVNVPEIGIKPKVFLVQLGEAAKRKSLLLFEDIRKSGIEIKYSPARDSIKSQLRVATRYNVRFALIFGQKEAIENTVILREMSTGIQETIPLEKIIDELKRRLKK